MAEKKLDKEIDFREIRRNTAKQIISYTLPKVAPAGSPSQYGRVRIPAIRTNLNKIEFNKVLDNDIEQYTKKIDEFDIETKKLNEIYFPEADIEGTLEEEPLKFNGELVRVGSGPSAIFYIEDNKFYTFAKGHGYLWHIIAERLGKPMGFRMNDEFDYKEQYALTKADPNDSDNKIKYEIDRGCNQYSVYNDNSYSRVSVAYLETNTYGGELTKQKVLMGTAADSTLYVKFVNKTDINRFKKLTITGPDSTPIEYDRQKSKPVRETFTTIDSNLDVNVYKNDGDGDGVAYKFRLIFHNGSSKIVTPNPENGQESWRNPPITFRKFTIPAEEINSKLWKIEIEEDVEFSPFYMPGTFSTERRWLTSTGGVIGAGAELYMWTGTEWVLDTNNTAVPYTVLGETYKWNGSFYETYVAPLPGEPGGPPLPPNTTAEIDYQMLDGNLEVLYGSDPRMQGGDKLVEDLWEAAVDTLTKNNISAGYQRKEPKTVWTTNIQRRSSGTDESKLLDVLTQTADDLIQGGTGYLAGNIFANVNTNTRANSSDVNVTYDELLDNYNLLTQKNMLIQTNPSGGRRDLEQAWEKGDGTAAFGGGRVNSTERAANRANRDRLVSVWRKCIEKRASGREERDLLRVLGHTARAKIRSGSGRIQ